MMEIEDRRNLQGTYWRDDIWLQRYPLNSETVLRDYFSLSTFYDLQCNNETLKTLNLAPSEIHTLAPGSEYLVVSATEPDFFVIKKQYRTESQETTPLAYYYVLQGTVYQAPDLFNAIFSKIKRCQSMIEKSFLSFSKAFDPLTMESEEHLEDVKRKFSSKTGWGKMKTGADVANAILSGYTLLPIPIIGSQPQKQKEQSDVETPAKKRTKVEDES
eukprot:g5852.t1